jgi:hypothetical protein
MKEEPVYGAGSRAILRHGFVFIDDQWLALIV